MRIGFSAPPKQISPDSRPSIPLSISEAQKEIDLHMKQQKEYNEMLDQVQKLQ